MLSYSVWFNTDFIGCDERLPTLNELQEFITENKHLPNIPCASEMQERGVNMAHNTERLLEKIEELTLYTLQQVQVLNAQTKTISQKSELMSQQAELLKRQSAQLSRLEAQIQ